MANLLADDDDDDMINLDEIEASITQGVSFKKKDLSPIDYAREYSKDLEDIGKKFKPADTIESKSINDLLNLPIEVKPQYNLKEESDASDDEKDDTYYPRQDAIPAWSKVKDEQLIRMTNEERKQSHIDRVLKDIDKNNDEADFINQEDEEDEFARIVEQIDLLKTNLETEGVDLRRIPEVNTDTSKKEAKNILKILQIKNDRLRYCDFFEEGILAVAYGLESVFNGKREIFGSKIDLTGYSDTVKVKLRRMRYDTSTFVSNIMKGYNISSGWRIGLELIPSLFLYSRDRRLKANDNLISDDAYKKAMQDLV